jgi:hypothetical protein
MTHYRGQRDKHGVCYVWRIDGTRKRPLRIRLDLENHSPTGFNWGYGGSGPAQLAIALLADALGNDLQAIRLHQSFKWVRIARIADDEWELTREEILDVVDQLKRRGDLDDFKSS